MTTEHVLTPNDRCPCGQPQTGSGYCSYECYSKHDLGAPVEPAPTSASMGEPLSEADRIAAIRARVAAATPRPETHWRKPLLASGEMRRHAESDVVFLLAELDCATARVGVLEGQLATAREELTERQMLIDRLGDERRQLREELAAMEQEANDE